MTAAVISIGIAFAFYVNDLKNQIESGVISNEAYNYNDVKQVIEGDKKYWLGTSEPRLTIVEFGDYGCPVCAKSFPVIREMANIYGNDIQYIWRDYPSVTQNSTALAMAARCAGEQGLFWPMHDKLFINQGQTSKKELTAMLIQIGGDEERFTDCLDKELVWEDISQDISDGDKIDILGTPTWFFNGKKVSGHIPRDAFIQIINNHLK